VNIGWRRLTAAALVTVLTGLNLNTQFGYLSGSASRTAVWATTILNLEDLRKTIPSGASVIEDVDGYAAANIVALYTNGHATWTASGIMPFAVNPNNRTRYESLEFGTGSNAEPYQFIRFKPPARLSDRETVIVLPTSDKTTLNNSSLRPLSSGYFWKPVKDVTNHLALINSNLGLADIVTATRNVALWQMEQDPWKADHHMQAFGRYLLLEVINPLPNSRLLLDFTTSPLAKTGITLQPVTILGERPVQMDFFGRGGGKLLSPPVAPRLIDGHYYVAIDMGIQARQPVHARHGVASLYNAWLSIDPRHMVGFVRNISLVTDEPAPPSSITEFPTDLLQAGVLYSGLYEDGWMAEAAQVRLSGGGSSGPLRIKGERPNLDDRPLTLSVLVDGEAVAERKLDPGDFEIEVPVETAGSHWVTLVADSTTPLPRSDQRVVSIRIEEIAFTEQNKEAR
jgi:hypothetical protein